MCFGNMTTSGIKDTTNNTSGTGTSTTSAPQWLQDAAQSNVNFASGVQGAGFQNYPGQMVANFAPQQKASFGQAGNIAGAAASALPAWAPSVLNYTTSGPGSVSPSTISSKMSPYMSQYVNLALQPQLQQAANTYMLQSQANQGQATSAGAFGDPRAGILQGNLGLNYAMENAGLVGNAYNAAFNTAIGAGAQDVSNDLNAQIQNQQLREQALQRQLTGANTIFGAGTTGTGMLNTYGAQQTAQSQAQLDALYNQYLMAQQYPFQTAQLSSSVQGAAGNLAPKTTTSSQTGTGTGNETDQAPDNSGYGLVGSFLGAGGSALGGYFTGAGTAAAGKSIAAAFSDKRVKTDIAKVGTMKDGLPVYRFRYKDDPPNVTRMGLMAQDVEKKYPDAVLETPKGIKMVDYNKATEKARELTFGLAA